MEYTNANSIQLFVIIGIIFLAWVYLEYIINTVLKFFDWIDSKIDPMLDKFEDWIEGKIK